MGGGATHRLRRQFTAKFVGICVTVGVLIRQNISVLPHRVESKEIPCQIGGILGIPSTRRKRTDGVPIYI
jgi:hypothetical protein